MPELVAVTTVRQGSAKNIVEKVRSEIFLDTARALEKERIQCVALHIACSPGYLRALARLNVVLVPEKDARGIGHARRQALHAARESIPSPYYLWVEPEKPDLPRFANRLKRLMKREETRLGLFNRISLKSYPVEQALYYAFCRSVASQCIGFPIDYGFGPMIIANDAVDEFLSYRGDYGDLWDSILIPQLRILRTDRKISILRVPFRNDSRMTHVESGNPTFVLKRVEQLANVIPSLLSEWQRLSSG